MSTELICINYVPGAVPFELGFANLLKSPVQMLCQALYLSLCAGFEACQWLAS